MKNLKYSNNLIGLSKIIKYSINNLLISDILYTNVILNTYLTYIKSNKYSSVII